MTGSLSIQVRTEVGSLLLDVVLTVQPGVLVLVGPNGAGKSSLLAAVLGVLPVQQGLIQVGTERMLDTSQDLAVPIELRHLGYVPQNYALFPHLTVYENVAFATKTAKTEQSRQKRQMQVEQILDDLGLCALAKRRPQHLSGGEKQRVALARALVVAPRALLLDEPLSALDVRARGEVRHFLAQTLQRLALPTLVVTHDAADAASLGQRVAVLEQGRITQEGSWDDLSARPQTPFIREFVFGNRVPRR